MGAGFPRVLPWADMLRAFSALPQKLQIRVHSRPFAVPFLFEIAGLRQDAVARGDPGRRRPLKTVGGNGSGIPLLYMKPVYACEFTTRQRVDHDPIGLRAPRERIRARRPGRFPHQRTVAEAEKNGQKNKKQNSGATRLKEERNKNHVNQNQSPSKARRSGRDQNDGKPRLPNGGDNDRVGADGHPGPRPIGL